jgi:hypothetical protein
MKILSEKHIENCSREISRWSKAVRLIHSLERNLPAGSFPEPDLIEPSRKPFDLRIVWGADNPGHSAKLRKRIASALKVEMKWYKDVDGYYGLRTRIRLGEKTTIYLRLLVESGHKKPSMA